MKRTTIAAQAARAPAAVMLAIAALLAGCGGGGSGNGPQQSANLAPTVSSIQSQVIDQDTSTGALAFTVDDDGGVGGISLSIASSDITIVPQSGIVLGGTGGSRTITLTPAEDAVGQLTITITARDAQGLQFSRVVPVSVRAVQQSITSYTTSTFAQTENDTPAQVSGITFVQDADGETTFDALLQ